MQTRRFLAFVELALALGACRPYDDYVPATSAISTHAAIIREQDASGELPSTAEPANGQALVPGGILPFFPLFPVPPIDIGRGYDPGNVPPGPGYPPRYEPLAPAYGPGGH